MSCSRGLEGGRVLRRVLRRGSKKVAFEKALRRRTYAFLEYDPVGMRPIYVP